jgi:2',3'-cyclic-nucleotide 2'-phosphodiesterase/3'-nucleotidase
MFVQDKVWGRRDFLKLVGQAGLLSAVPTLASAAAALNPETVCISILHTTDLHGHILPTFDYEGNSDRGGLARCATQIRRWQQENPSSILIDIGDVYQGTEVSLRSQGALMIDLLNYLDYDAWVIGNHEFDWGLECLEQALKKSNMPVLAANMSMEEKPAGAFPDTSHPFAKIQPFILKEIAGIKLAVIGVTTPGMQFWLWPDFIKGVDFRHPVEPVRRAIAKAKSEGANAIVLTGHMGLKNRTGGDDFANTVMALTSEFPDIVVFIAGHTHQDIPNRLTNGVLFTQADHFGIHVGRVDLLFDRSSKKLLRRQAICELMDNRFALDGTIVSRAKPQLAESEKALSEPIGDLAETLRGRSDPGRPSDLEVLIGAAIMEALLERQIPVDGVMHGTFDDNADLVSGPKTVSDIWTVIPFENYIVTAQLFPDEIKSAMQEVFASHEKRNLLGFDVKIEGRGDGCRLVSMTLANHELLDPSKKYTIAFNSFDARSGGHHFMKLRALLERPESKCIRHSVQTRDALIAYFQRHKVVRRVAAMSPLPVAA